ncbi:unnamed protein product, partial [Porites lobata]
MQATKRRRDEAEDSDEEGWNVFPSLQNLRCDAEQLSKKTNLPSDLRTIAANKGFFVSDNQASGNCLFHALSEQLPSVRGIQISHKELRKTLVQFLDENPNLHEGTSLFNFVSGYPSWREYLQSMAKDGTWGDHVVLFAAANHFQTSIRIISSLDREIVVQPDYAPANTTPLVLGHIHELHYVSLQPRQESKIVKSSEDTPNSSEGSDRNTHQITTGVLSSSSKNTASNTKNQRTTSKRKRKKKRKRERKERTLKECISHPPELNKVLPSLADIKAITRPSKHADLPVDVLLLTVKNCEFVACFSELKNPYRCWFDGLGYVYFCDVDGSQDKVKVALFKCYENSSCPGGSLVSVKNAATLLRPKAVISVGVCSGLHPEKSKLGDVVVSAKLTTYASKVVINNQEHSTGMRNYVSKRFLNVIKNCADGWKAPLKNVADAQQVQVHTAAEFLSGPEQVISGQRRDQLAETNHQAIAMENEGEGVFTAAVDCGIEWLIVKGIADYADGSQLASESWSSYASVMAASLVAHMLNEPRVFHSWPHYQGLQPQELITHYDETLVAPFIERMKKHVRDVTDKPYRDLKSPFHNPGEGPRRDLKLDEIFTNLIVYDGRAKYDFSGDRAKQLNEYHKASKRLRPTLPGDIFNAKERKILVVGRPGIGKTMFSTKILRNWASDNLFNETQKSQVDFKVAFLFKLRMFNSRNQELNLREILDHSEYSTALSEELWNYIRHNPERVLLIFDGFDEYSGRTKINKDDIPYRNSEEDRMPVYFLMKKIVEGKILTGATILTTTRPNAVSCITSLHFDKTVEILGFSTEQVNNYVEKFTKEADKAETIKQHITSNLNLVAFCYVPVNCFIICSCLLELLGNTGFTSLPTRLTEIYSIAVRMFYFSYDDDQYRHNKTEGQQYFLKPFKELPSSVQNVFTRLGKIAFDGIKNGRLIFESHEVNDLESNGLFHRLPDFRDRPLAEGRAQYCFLHLTLQEFLAAKYLVDTLSSEQLRGFVAAHIEDGAWKVVMQFMAGLLAEKEEQSTDIFSDLLPSETSTKEVEIEMNEDSEEQTETQTWWPAEEDRDLVVTLFNCMYENNASDREVQKKLAKIGCNALNFSSCNLSPLDCFALVHALKSVEGILELYLGRNNLQSLGCIEIAKLLPGNQHNQGFCELRRLNLMINNITDEAVKDLSTALTDTNCNLNSLVLYNNNITDEAVKHLSTALTHTNCKLNSLNLSFNNITDEGVKHLSTALTHTNCKLNGLYLRSNKITDEGVKHLSTALTHTNCKLNSLDLKNNNITDEAVKHLSTALTHTNCKLNSLNLKNNNITDEAVKHLSTALTHTNCKLNSLDLAHNNTTDEGVKHLSTAFTHTNCKLNSLGLKESNITDEAVKHLSTALTHT